MFCPVSHSTDTFSITLFAVKGRFCFCGGRDRTSYGFNDLSCHVGLYSFVHIFTRQTTQCTHLVLKRTLIKTINYCKSCFVSSLFFPSFFFFLLFFLSLSLGAESHKRVPERSPELPLSSQSPCRSARQRCRLQHTPLCMVPISPSLASFDAGWEKLSVCCGRDWAPPAPSPRAPRGTRETWCGRAWP